MIQRPQTLFFLAVTTVCLMLMSSNTVFYTTENTVTQERCEVEYDETRLIASDGSSVENNIWTVSFSGAVGALSFIIIFLYRNRKLQLLLASFNYLFILGLVVMMYMYSINVDYFKGDSIQSTFTFYALIPMGLLLLNYFGAKGIRRDEQLVRSMDRLR